MADLLVLKLTPRAPKVTESDIHTFLQQWATSVDAIKQLEPQDPDKPMRWVVRLHTPEDKSEFPMLIEKKMLNCHPVRVCALPLNDFRGEEPPFRPMPMLFEFDDCPIPFRRSDLRQTAKKVVPIMHRPDRQ
jgi:hypothetical protein